MTSVLSLAISATLARRFGRTMRFVSHPPGC